MSARTWAVAAAALCMLATPPVDAADSFSTLGSGLKDREQTEVVLSGYFRSRLVAARNLDLDRGPTPSGSPLYPVPAGDPSGQWLTGGDLRLRTNLSIFAPRGGVVVRARADVLDNLAMGSQAIGAPSASASQDTSPTSMQAIAIRRLYAEAALPFGVLAVGRMANTWGVGMLGNGGEGIDQDSTDAVDRLAFVTPLLHHIFAVAYDISATGPTIDPPAAGHSGKSIDAGPLDDVRSLTFAVVRGVSTETLDRRDDADLVTHDWGLFYAHRWQSHDSLYWLHGANTKAPAPITERGFSAHVVDGWLLLHGASWQVQTEVAVMQSRYEQPSIVPGVSYHQPLDSLQFGAVVAARIGGKSGLFARFVGAFASGDPSPAMGYEQPIAGARTQPGDLHGAQADLPRDGRIDNFRMHRDFRLDRILFREIVGGITDATVGQLTVGCIAPEFGAGTLRTEFTVVASMANEATSAPGGKTPLGVEIDPTLTYLSRDGFRLQLQYAALLPLAGLDNPTTGQAAQPAQLWRLHLGYLF